jgi:hypothetical protein
MTIKRYALIRNARSEREVEAYLPDNYKLEGVVPAWTYDHRGNPQTVYVIGGRDSAGWTLDSYVIPRFASGLIYAEEIDLSHPIMKQVA